MLQYRKYFYLTVLSLVPLPALAGNVESIAKNLVDGFLSVMVIFATALLGKQLFMCLKGDHNAKGSIGEHVVFYAALIGVKVVVTWITAKVQ